MEIITPQTSGRSPRSGWTMGSGRDRWPSQHRPGSVRKQHTRAPDKRQMRAAGRVRSRLTVYTHSRRVGRRRLTWLAS